MGPQQLRTDWAGPVGRAGGEHAKAPAIQARDSHFGLNAMLSV
jgi:hypothetical protein